MFQLSVTFVLMILFVSKVSPLLQDEQENKMNIDINLNKMANILNNNKTIKSSMKTIEKETINENNNFILKNSINTVVSTSEIKKKRNEIQNCSSTKEQLDMLNCNVTPHDDDDDDNTEQIQSLNFTESTITIADITSINVETDHSINNNNSGIKIYFIAINYFVKIMQPLKINCIF